MRRAILVALSLMLVVSTAGAQEWSSAEQEVWSFIKTCNDHFEQKDMEAAMECFHEDFIGWRAEDPMPRGKDWETTIGRFIAENTTTHASHLQPIEIRVYGDLAFAHYLGTSVTTGPDGSLTQAGYAWTDVLIKENGRWYWIGDHGHPVQEGS